MNAAWRRWPDASTPAICVALFVAMIAVVLIFWMVGGPESRIDDGGDYGAFYEPVARRILATGAPVYADGSPATRYPPGYPFLLAGLFGLSQSIGVSEVTVLQAFALFGTAVSGLFLFLLARTVWPPALAIAAPLFWISCPMVLWMSGLESSEVAFTMVFYGSCWCVWLACTRAPQRSLLYLLSGVLLGCAMLIRPIAIGAGILIAAAIWFRLAGHLSARARLTAMMLLLLGNLLAVMPWELWVYQKSGRIVLLSEGGVPSIRDGLTFATNLKGYRQGVWVPADVRTVMKNIQAGYQDLHTMGDVARALTEQARQHPAAVAKLFLLKAARSWYATDTQRREGYLMLIQAIYLLPVILGVGVAWRMGGNARLLVLFVVPLTVYFWAMTIVVLSIVRYMVPAMGLLFLLTPGAVLAAQRALVPGAAIRQPLSVE